MTNKRMVNLFLLTGSIVDFIEPSNTNQPQFDWIKEKPFFDCNKLTKTRSKLFTTFDVRSIDFIKALLWPKKNSLPNYSQSLKRKVTLITLSIKE